MQCVHAVYFGRLAYDYCMPPPPLSRQVESDCTYQAGLSLTIRISPPYHEALRDIYFSPSRCRLFRDTRTASRRADAAISRLDDGRQVAWLRCSRFPYGDEATGYFISRPLFAFQDIPD